MRRMMLVAVLGSLLLWSSLALAGSTPAVTILCWNTAIGDSPLIDTLRIALQEVDPTRGGFAIPALLWIGDLGPDQPPLYEFSSPASAYRSRIAPGVVNLSVYLDNRSPLFRGNENCRLRMTVELDLLNGVAQLACTGTDAPFTTMDISIIPDPTCGQAEALVMGMSGASRQWAAGDEQFNILGR
jgi:hypothetical protein